MYKSHFHVLDDDEDDNDYKVVGEVCSFKVLILPAVFEMMKVFELNNSHTVGPGTNFIQLPHSLDFAGRLKPVFLPLSWLLELCRTLARLHRAVWNTFPPVLKIIMAKSCLHLLLGTVYVKPSHTCIYVIKRCQPKCPDRSLCFDLSRCY